MHSNDSDEITKRIDELELDSKLITTKAVNVSDQILHSDAHQSKILWSVLLINFTFFLIEMTTGLISRSMGLVADSLDMFADATVYGLSLLAVGKAISKKKWVAKLAGYFQFTLAVIGFLEVVRRFIGFDGLPDFQTMIGRLMRSNETFAAITQHIPQKSFQKVRYYGWYSNKSRGMRLKQGIPRIRTGDQTLII